MRTYLVFVPGVAALVAALVLRGPLGLVLAGIGLAWCVATGFFIWQASR